MEIFDCEKTEVLFENNKIRVEKILSYGNASPRGFWYDQDEDEWVSLVKGRAVIAFDDGEVCLAAGENMYIPAHKKHRVSGTSADAEWLCVFVK